MTDLHTHILPGMDDGAADARQSLSMLKCQWDQGVKTVALTPHYYPQRRSIDSFLRRREDALRLLRDGIEASADQAQLPELRLGAEVYYVPGMWEWPELPRLCYEGTKVLLIELPFTPWNDEMFRELHRILSRRGITPMIAHLDRYLRVQKPNQLQRLLDMELPYQVSASAVLHPFFRRARKLWLQGGVPISDCHDERRRPPNLGKLQSFICRKYGKAGVDAFIAQTEILNQL